LIDFYCIGQARLDVYKFITEGKLVEQKLEGHYQSMITSISVNNIYEKLILQMEERIVEMKKHIDDLESKFDTCEK
jgi:hypothetical protein